MKEVTGQDTGAPAESPGVRALLVEPRILRRVIRLDRRLANIGLTVPHGTNYVIERARLLAYTELEELGLPPNTDLPRNIILLAKSTDDIQLHLSPDKLLNRYRRELFHAQVHLEMQRLWQRMESERDFVRRRWRQLGDVEHDEIRSVLRQDQLLFSTSNDRDAYGEFVAVYLELKYFAEHLLPIYFPAIREWSKVDRMIRQDLDHAAVFAAAQSSAIEIAPPATPTVAPPAMAARLRSADASRRIRTRRLGPRAMRAASLGNSVKAAILWTLAADVGISNAEEPPTAAARRELVRLITRLKPVLGLDDTDTASWEAALWPLLKPAASGFWTVEARLLYDLQKVCVEDERGIYKYDWFRWFWSRGQTPLRRSLPLLREVLITKHLRSATRRLSSARISSSERDQLSTLLARASERAERRVRENIRPIVLRVLNQVGLRPQTTLDRVAQSTVVEELIDMIVEQGVVNLSHLRDAIARNDIKLPDLGGAAELIHGDLLLLADRQLAHELTGLYRPGAIYLRSAQRLSSIAFGTRTGRFLTRYVALPFGGAYLAFEGIRHLMEYVQRHIFHVTAVLEPTRQTKLTAVIGLGTFLLMLIHLPRFRNWCQLQTRLIWTILRTVMVEFPSRILQSPVVQEFLRGPIYAAIRSYLIWPGIITIIAQVILAPQRGANAWHWSIETFLATALFLNSRVGKYIDEFVADLVLRTWQELRLRVFAALLESIIDTFRLVFAYLERLVYTVDEWLRFRVGDHRSLRVLKLLGGTCWFFISYVVILVFTLLIEPQINPVKHFPVVTVSHKLILPTGQTMIDNIAPMIGWARASTLVWSTLLLIPGVFGFLVWELKNNWRLYDANRPRKLSPVPVGHHGETMVRLLRPGFHSGTLPKLFAKSRRSVRAAQDDDNWQPAERRLAMLRRLEESIRRFIERRLLKLWSESERTEQLTATVTHLHLATNFIEVEIEVGQQSDQTILVTWQEHANHLVTRAQLGPWINHATPSVREACAVALAALAQWSDAEEFVIEPASLRPAPFDWPKWARYWEKLAPVACEVEANT